DTAVTDDLAAEGVARDVVRAVQQARREAGLEVSDRITVTLLAESHVGDAVRAHEKFLRAETLADDVAYGSLDAHPADAPTASVGDGASVGVLVVRA
ncbi:MAG TPA: DUF5915 domain-containing protein, partial [Pseudonocardiaceae bacterium]